MEVDCPCRHDWLTGEYHHPKCPEAKKLRDSWRTPKWLCDLLPEVDLDPASNQLSHVRARRSCCLERGEDGLRVPWNGSVFLNGPYSYMLPWVDKARKWMGSGMDRFLCLVKVDPPTRWWKMLTARHYGHRVHMWLFDKRLQHEPPPRIRPSTNNFPSALVEWRAHDSRALSALDSVATLWM